jgi:hypothetical protein
MKLYSMLCVGVIAALMVTAGGLYAQEGGKGQEKKGGQEKVDKKDGEKKEGDKKDEGKGGDERAMIIVQRYSYPLDTCPIKGEKLESKATEFLVNGHLVRTCCGNCKAKVQADPTATLKKVEDGVVAAQKAGYPMMVCAATGTKLDDKAVDYVYGTRLVRLANKDAVAAFEKDPKAAMAKLDDAYIKAQVATYPMKKCVISGHEFTMGPPVDKLYGTTLVRFCCNDCVPEFEKDASKHLKAIADARKPTK